MKTPVLNFKIFYSAALLLVIGITAIPAFAQDQLNYVPDTDAMVLANNFTEGFSPEIGLEDEAQDVKEYPANELVYMYGGRYQEGRVLVYPSPVDDLAFIGYYAGEGVDVALQVFDITGKVIHESKAKGMLNENIDFRTARPGTYFIKVSMPNRIKTQMITIR